MDIKNIFANIPEQTQKEIFETIIKKRQLKIERIIDQGHSTPEGHWNSQDKNEWVIILKGSGSLMFEGDKEATIMKPGDYINIPAHKKHRVEWTDPKEETIWLAVHY